MIAINAKIAIIGEKHQRGERSYVATQEGH